MRKLKKILMIVCGSVIGVLLLAGGIIFVLLQMSALPASLNMGSDKMTMNMSGMPMGTMPAMAGATSVTQLIGPQTDAPVKTFDLTAQAAKLDLGNGKTVDAWTYNGTAPGPELRVQQGDRVVVHLHNTLPVSVTIHWHGVRVPNAEDGVAGLTQDAVKPGQSFTYSFIATDTGTYWYHSHQQSFVEETRGLYGTFVVEPKNPPVHDDRDYTLALQEWRDETNCFRNCAETLTLNGKRTMQLAAKPGETVRLRLVNTGEGVHLPTVIGAPVEVVAVDGQDLNGPTPLSNTLFPIAPAQRYDLRFRMPDSGTVTFLDGDPDSSPAGQHPAIIFGDGTASAPAAYPDNAPHFDLTRYGTSGPATLTANTHSDAQYTLDLGNHLGFFDKQFTMLFTINGQAFPNIPMITVQPGQRVRLHINNPSDIPHAMHLHGHTFILLARNGQPLTGSPVHLDTVLVSPGESDDISFVADNPGLWMFHCHMLRHAAEGMDMMIVYPNISTPYTIGTDSGNEPD